LRAALAAALAAGLGALPVQAGEAVGVEARVVSRFMAFSAADRFGALDFLGGLELVSRDGRVASLSGLDVLADGGRMIAVSDRGELFAARLVRDASGRLAGVRQPEVEAIDPENDGHKELTDAEDLAALDPAPDGAPRYALAYERQGAPLRILRLGADGPVFEAPPPFPDARLLRGNGGLEAVALAPVLSGWTWSGRLVAVAERSLRGGDEATSPGWIVGEGEALRFAVARSGGYTVTAARFLPRGDLILLERVFSPARGAGLRLRRIARADIAPGATLAGEILLEARGYAYQLDNMEGMSLRRGADGRTVIALLSDDNGNVFQRTLLLEFALAPETPN